MSNFFTAPNMDFTAKLAAWKGPTNDDYQQGKEYYILCQKMTDGRIAVFKSSHHYNEPPGYKVYSSRDDINNDFNFKE